MDFKDLGKKIKELQWKKLIYPAIGSVGIFIVLICFAYTVNFLSKNINHIFVPESEELHDPATNIDMNKLNLIANKLGITFQKVVEEKPIIAEEPVIAPEIKTELKIQVLNSTKTSGLAGSLKTELEQAGFADVQTGNSSPTEVATIIKIKTATAEKYPNSIIELKTIVGSKYQPTDQNHPDEDAFDIVIIIGAK